MSNEAELKEKIRLYTDELNRIKEKERIKLAEGLVGRCFKYRNCYSLPQSEDDKWWAYRKVTGIDEHGGLLVTAFQKDKYGKIEIENGNAFGSINGWTEIPVSEFVNAWAEILADINSITPTA